MQLGVRSRPLVTMNSDPNHAGAVIPVTPYPRDGIYVEPIGTGFPTDGSSNSIEANLTLEAKWKVGAYVVFEVRGTYFPAREFLMEDGGHSANHAGAQIELKV